MIAVAFSITGHVHRVAITTACYVTSIFCFDNCVKHFFPEANVGRQFALRTARQLNDSITYDRPDQYAYDLNVTENFREGYYSFAFTHSDLL